MSRILIKDTPSGDYGTADPQAERMEARIAELDSAYGAEERRLKSLLSSAKARIFISRKTRKGK